MIGPGRPGRRGRRAAAAWARAAGTTRGLPRPRRRSDMCARGAFVLAALAVAMAACDKKKVAAPAEAADASAASPAGGALLLGHVTPLTGDQAASGQSTDHGVRLAVNEQN